MRGGHHCPQPLHAFRRLDEGGQGRRRGRRAGRLRPVVHGARDAAGISTEGGCVVRNGIVWRGGVEHREGDPRAFAEFGFFVLRSVHDPRGMCGVLG